MGIMVRRPSAPSSPARPRSRARSPSPPPRKKPFLNRPRGESAHPRVALPGPRPLTPRAPSPFRTPSITAGDHRVAHARRATPQAHQQVRSRLGRGGGRRRGRRETRGQVRVLLAPIRDGRARPRRDVRPQDGRREGRWGPRPASARGRGDARGARASPRRRPPRNRRRGVRRGAQARRGGEQEVGGGGGAGPGG